MTQSILKQNIYALSSGAGKAGVSVVRVSGPDIQGVIEYFNIKNIEPRIAKLVKLVDPKTDEVIDHCLALYFSSPNSFTGEDVIEFHLHGSKAVIEHLFLCLEQTGLCQMAEAGEFSRRAFKNQKLDLTRVEAIGAILESETLAQKKQALRQLDGFAENAFSEIRQTLLKSIALLEACIDFSEEDIPDDLHGQIFDQVKEVYDLIDREIQNSGRSAKLNDGFNIAIIGAPNVGKSSLMNLMASSEVAIVSDIAGTTRDMIKARLDIDGYLVNLIDSAGIRVAQDKIEEIGVERSEKLLSDADLVLALYCDDASYETLQKYELSQSILIRNKADLSAIESDEKSSIIISVKDQQNIDAVYEAIKIRLHDYFDNVENDLVTRQRHKNLLENARNELSTFLEDQDLPEEILAEYLRLAITQIGKITGHVDVEEILGEIFAGFCIGK